MCRIPLLKLSLHLYGSRDLAPIHRDDHICLTTSSDGYRIIEEESTRGRDHTLTVRLGSRHATLLNNHDYLGAVDYAKHKI